MARSLLLPTLLLAACSGGADDSAPGGDGLDGRYDPGAFTDVELSLSDAVVTVGHLRFAAEGASEAGAWIAPAGGGEGHAVSAGEGWDAVLFGLKPETAYDVYPTATIDGEEVYGDTLTLTTGTLPRDVPTATVTLAEDGRTPGFLAVGLVSIESWALVYDQDGDVVWYYANPHAGTLTSRVLRSVDGRSLLVSAAGAVGSTSDETFIDRVSYDGTRVESLPISGFSHDFCELDDGRILYIGTDRRDWHGDTLAGDTLVERSPDGGSREVWNGWDWYDPADFTNVDAGTEYTHANVLKYDAGTGLAWLGMRNASSIARIDLATGELVSRFLGTDSDLTLTEGTAMAGQHSFTLLDDGVVVMDNRLDTDEFSRVVQYAIDEQARTARQTWAYASPEGYHLLGLGDAVRLPDGHTRVVWSSAGQLDELDASGTLIGKINLDVGAGFGYGSWSDDPQALPW